MAATAVLRVVEREARVFRHLWRGSVFSNFLAPVLFLGAMGLGLGGLIDDGAGELPGGLDYLTFVTPGLLAATAMQGAASESLWPVMAGTKWIRTYHGMVATPLSATDVFVGHVVWAGVRAAVAATAFLAVAAALGGVPSAWGVVALPAAVLTATAFAAPLAAFAGTQDTDVSFPVIMRLGVMPLFLFSGTFFPVAQLPGAVQPVAWISPLWHGVELCRAATTGSGMAPIVAAGHVAALGACAAAGCWWGSRTFGRRLTQ